MDFIPSHRLPLNLPIFGFVEREKAGNKTVGNRCGRDFLYYALNYYRPDVHNPTNGNPRDIERKSLFGLRVPGWLVWTFISFLKVPKYFSSLGLEIEINGKIVKSFPQFVHAALSRPPSIEVAMRMIEKSVDDGIVSGVDISVALGGLVDHVMFVYGYDEDNLYILIPTLRRK